jgi:aminoglycoside phosphotransferase (APT) family kinase protein
MTDTSSDVTEIRQGHALNIPKLTHYLTSHISSFQGPMTIKQFGHGQSNPTFLITDTATDVQYVMRKRPPGKIMSKTAHRVDREFKVMQALQHTKVPVPEMYVLCEDLSVVGQAFYIMEFKKGRIFKDASLAELPKAERRGIWLALIDVLATLHNVNFRAVGLETFGRDHGYFSRQLKSLTKVSKAQLAASAAVPGIPFFDELVSILQEQQPQDSVSIVHGDFKMDNCIFHPTEPKVIAVIDWELSTIGHYGADLGNSLSTFFVPGDGVGSIFGNAMDPASCIALGIPSREEILQVYCSSRTPVLPLNVIVSEMYYYLGFYCWKNAIITQGIAARVARGQASSAKAASIGALTPVFGDLSKYMLEIYAKGKKQASNL